MNDSMHVITVDVREYRELGKRLNKQRETLAEIRRIATEMRNGPLDPKLQKYATLLLAELRSE